MPHDSLIAQIRAYYTAYYSGILGLPNWQALVEQRIVDEEREAERLRHFQDLAGRVTGKRLLNIGCGTGGLNIVAARWGAITDGIDPDTEALDICSQKREWEGLPVSHLWFDQHVAEALPYSNGIFDIVYCFSTIEHVQDVEKAMREMVRVTRPGGIVYIHAPNHWGCYEAHFKVFWPPLLWWARWLGVLYLIWVKKRLGAYYIYDLNRITYRRLVKALAGERVAIYRVRHEHNRRNPGLGGWLECLWMRAFRIDPHVEVLIFKVGG